MKRVLLDCDGVLSDFIGSVCDLVRCHGGGNRTPAEVTEFDFCKSLNLDVDVAREVKREISTTPGWWSSLKVLPGALEGVAALREVADVYIVTSPWNSCRSWLCQRETWLKRHFDIPHARVIATSAKHLVSGDMLVDDKTETCVAWDLEQGAAWRMPDGSSGETRAVQWQTPHNRRDAWSGHSTSSWAQLLEWCK